MTRGAGAIAEGGARALALAVSPQGALRLERGGEDEGRPVGPDVTGRVEAAFEAGAGHGLLHLGLV